MKPSFIVRTRAEFRRQRAAVRRSSMFSAFTWSRFCGGCAASGDRLLLAAAHLLTAIGFAVLLSRPDPLRDSLLFVATPKASLLGLALMAAVSLVDFGARRSSSSAIFRCSARCRCRSLLILFGCGPGSSAKVNLGPRAADRSDPVAARVVSRRLFRAALGAAPRASAADAIRDVRLPAWINLPRGEYVLPVLAGVGAGARCSFSSRRISARRFSLLRLSRRVRGGARPGRHGGRRLRAARCRLLRRVPPAHLADARRARAHVAVALGQRGRRRRPGGAGIWAMATGGLRHRPRSRRLALSAGRTHRSHPGRGRRGTGRRRAVARRGSLRDDGVARLPHRPPRRHRLRLLPRHGADAVPDRAGADDGGGHPRRDPADRRRHAVSELRRLGDGRELRGAGDARVDPRRRRPRDRFRAVPRADALARRGARRGCARAARASSSTSRSSTPTTTSSGRISACRPTGTPLRIQPARAGRRPRRSRAGRSTTARPAARDRRRATRSRRRATRTRSSASRSTDACPDRGRAMLSARRPRLSLLGDARTRSNWSAPNTSYVERDAEERLRGFDDHAATVDDATPAGPADARGPARLSRARAAAASSARAGASGGRGDSRTGRATCG